MTKNYFSALITASEINKKFRELAHELHPDKNKTATTESFNALIEQRNNALARVGAKGWQNDNEFEAVFGVYQPTEGEFLKPNFFKATNEIFDALNDNVVFASEVSIG